MITDIAAVLEAESPAPSRVDPARAAGMKFPDSLVYRGYSAPVRIECDVQDLEVEGEIPAALNGAYIRACGDPRYPPRLGADIFLNGDGMLHQVRLQNGHADLKTRYVRTEKFELERAARRALFGAYRNPFTDDPTVVGKNRGTANTSAFWHAGKLLALKEDSRPTLIDPVTLETRGEYDFDDRLSSQTFTAHPKIDPRTGEVVAFGYNTHGVSSPIIELFFISAAGELTRTECFEAPYASMVHDFMVSANFIIFTICPMINDWERVRRGEPFFHWDGQKPTMVAVIPRTPGGAQKVRWFRSEVTCMETHTFNAWEDGDQLHLEHFVTGSGWLSQFPDINDADAQEKPPFAYRWTIDLASQSDGFTVERIFPQIGEMPMIDLRHMMARTRHYYFGTTNLDLGPMLEWGPKGPPFTCIGHFDATTGRQQFYYAGAHSAPEEPLFVPRADDAPEADGWILTIVGRRDENRTDLVILDAQNIAAGPVATVKFPCRLHEGFHGCWVPGAALT